MTEDQSFSKEDIYENIKRTLCKSIGIRPSSVWDSSSIHEHLKKNIKYCELTSFTRSQYVKKGGEGVVFFGEWDFSPVAIKQIKDAALTTDLLEQLNILMGISNNNCVNHYGFSIDTDQNVLYIIMERMQINLFDYIIQNPTLSLGTKLEIFMYIAIGMNHLHSMNPPILHLDLKMENVLLNLDHNKIQAVKICDFGLSKFKTEEMVLEAPIGTLRAISPEILTSHSCSTKSDVYSFGKF